MGRETKFLLAVLGVLVGAFVGVLSMKLLVPRPPAGAGPDVDPQHVPIASQDIVEPPALEPRGGSLAFTTKRDPFLTRTEFTEPAADAPSEEATPADVATPGVSTPPDDFQPTPRAIPTTDAAPIVETADLLPPPAFQAPAVPPPPPRMASMPPVAHAPHASIAGTHTTVAGDTWWSIAERAYGDGRLYRALYAWNRRLDPRVSTAPGTRLEVPPQPKLAAAWPKLMP